MKRHVVLPAPQLSQVKEVDLDPDMTGRHYSEIASSDGQVPEEVMLSVVNDLIDQDGNQLTLPELRYLFMLIKISSLENNYTVQVECTQPNCGHMNSLRVHVSDADLNRTRKSYKAPKVFLNTPNEKEWQVVQPTMRQELFLLHWLMEDKAIPYEDLSKGKNAATYTWLRCLCHLKSEDWLIRDVSDLEEALTWQDRNKYKAVDNLYKTCNEVDSYGVQDKIYQLKCKECGGKLIFRLPFLHGLSA